ncbi:hypothetical protein [Nostoc sp. DedQUE07]|uniref:hypothetical protein n=1 Tax=Nostoc sp. DedQUE07 TaxID=3075392 RepID=UPI002AD45F91|nr:hypothetical protein [Nostoc sp. DedQUE07]MDZ8131885.1 hypothetical protein [Nostoc sp. DedQUE07]
MDRLAEFNAIEIAQLLGGTLREETNKKLRIYVFEWGEIEIYENGGEVNVYFEYLRGVDFQPPTGIRISKFTFGFSIPYTGCDEAEFAARLLFYLRKAAHGVDLLDYFVEKKNVDSTIPTLIPTQTEGIEKLKCDCSKWLGISSLWSIYLNKDFEFEVYYCNTLFGTYKSFATALRRLGITQI